MNWLAHVLLSRKDPKSQMANLLADPLKLKRWEGACDLSCEGMHMHYFIDNFIDTHTTTSNAKAILSSKGALRGVVIDLLYDHFLSLHWDRFCSVEREQFLSDFRFFALKEVSAGHYPPRAKEVISKVVATNQLSSYIHIEGVKQAFERLERRMSQRLLSKEPIAAYWPKILSHKEQLEGCFLEFFPQLIEAFIKEFGAKNLEHLRVD